MSLNVRELSGTIHREAILEMESRIRPWIRTTPVLETDRRDFDLGSGAGHDVHHAVEHAELAKPSLPLERAVGIGITGLPTLTDAVRREVDREAEVVPEVGIAPTSPRLQRGANLPQLLGAKCGRPGR